MKRPNTNGRGFNRGNVLQESKYYRGNISMKPTAENVTVSWDRYRQRTETRKIVKNNARGKNQ